ncbi:MAG: class I SAM-dependent methyltransferase [Alphaproteobacteria bacterium]|nr:class I SAM-dependent methyltransferase [Alphaproteobacteria bacterium]
MPIIGELTEFYRQEGIELCAGLAPIHVGGLPKAPFTWFFREGKSVTDNLGIAVQEVYFLEHVLAAYAPTRALIIGNSMGWSTLALGLLMPKGMVVAMDTAPDPAMREGLALTNRIATRHNLPVRAVQGTSPQDVANIVDAELGGLVDFAFIDGLHTNEQVVRDYIAVRAKATPDAVYLFHDVVLFGLRSGMSEIGKLAGRMPRLLLGTPSGMAILFDEQAHPALARAVAAFAPPETAIRIVRQAAWDWRHRHFARWRRSVKKRVNRMREFF